MEDLPLGRIAALMPEFAVKDLPLGRTLMMMHARVTNIVRGGRTYHNMRKKTITHGSGNAYFLKSVHLSIVSEDVWL